MEGRALEFFRVRVAPVLSKYSSTRFWSTLVSQVGQQEPAVRHALVCISSMYEGLGETSHSLLATPRERFAITQYNMSLNQLASAVTDENIVLLVCLLFICIEMLRGNKTTAIEHCRHGINICNNMPTGLLGWAKQELQPMFLRLASFPYLLGIEATEFPEPVGLISDPLATDVTAEEKSTAWNYLVNRSLRLVRVGLSYHQGSLRHLSMPEDLFREQKCVYESLVLWQSHYRTARITHPPGPEELESHLYNEIECIVGKIWVSCCLNADEMVYDQHTADFEEIIHLSEQMVHLRSTESGPRPIFTFEMGFMPFIYFVVIKCRHLDMRLTALRHLSLISYEQENLFHVRVMYYICRRSIEIEHGICLDLHEAEPASTSNASLQLPPDDVRLRGADITDEREIRKDENGQETEYRRGLFLSKSDAIVPGFAEWVKIGTYTGKTPYLCGRCSRSSNTGIGVLWRLMIDKESSL